MTHLTTNQFINLLADADLSSTEYADYLGASRRTVYNWSSGREVIPAFVENSLKEIAAKRNSHK